MLTETDLIELKKEELPARAAALSSDEIVCLVDLLAEKNDKIRYGAFQLLNERSMSHADVFPCWDVFAAKLASDNSYQRSIGVMLLAANARWDEESKTAAVLDAFLAILQDEKPITVRQCIQSLLLIVPYHRGLAKTIAERLLSLSLLELRDTMRKLILLDIVDVLLLIRETESIDGIDAYLSAALSGDLLDAKTKKQILARMGTSAQK
ncbi:MAG: hypothetical protein VB091_02625 [Christensenella sp.]|nr:hypothetical protein [Christensenella sp.]